MIYFFAPAPRSPRIKQLVTAAMTGAIANLPTLFLDDTVYVDVICHPKTQTMTQISDSVDYDVMIGLGQQDDEIVRSVFHEMKHVEQLYDGRMEFVDDTYIYWEGINYGRSLDLFKLPENQYDQLPWEVDASEFEHHANRLLIDLDKQGMVQSWHNKHEASYAYHLRNYPDDLRGNSVGG